MTDSFQTLLTGSWNFCLAHLKPILIGAIVLGVLMFGFQKLLETQAVGSINDRFGNMEDMEKLAERIEKGDEEAFQEMMMQLGVMGDEGEVDEDAMQKMTLGFMKGMLPTFVLFFVVMMFLTLVANTYFMVLAIDGGNDAIAVLKRVPRLIFPMLGVWIWSFLRSFTWIPFLGVLIAIVIGPRLLFSSVILVKEDKGVLESVRLSYSRSRGYWGKIVGNMLVMAVLAWLLMLVAMLGLGYVSSSVMMLGGILGVVVQQLVMAYGTVFMVRLANTVMANQLVVATKKKK